MIVQRGGANAGVYPPHVHDHDTDLTHVGVTAHVAIDAHIAASAGVHGVAGTVVGTTDSQTLTNKTLTSPTLTTPTIASFVNALHTHVNSAGGGQIDHGAAVTGLSDDDHAQYALLAGRAGGQTLYGGTASGNNLTLHSTSHATKGKIFFGASSAYDGVNVRLGIGTTSPVTSVDVSTSVVSDGIRAIYTGTSSPSNSSQLGVYVNDGAAMAAVDRLGQIAFGGHNGSAVVNAAFIIGTATELWSGTARGSKLEFFTTPNTTATVASALTLEQNQDATFAGNINIATSKVYKIANTQVLGVRDTGWTAMTGSSNKATAYDTATVTLAQLAGRVMALQAALTTHGVLGA